MPAPSTGTVRTITLELDAGNASIAELGKSLAQFGVNIRDFKRDYDAATARYPGDVIPAVVKIDDRGVTFRLKTPPTAHLIRRAIGRRGASTPGKEPVAALTRRQLTEIAERKLPDLNTTDLAAAIRTVAGTARSMGVTVDPDRPVTGG